MLGPFWSLENCRAAAKAKLDALGWARGGAYQCGFRCDKRGDGHIRKGVQR